MSSEAKATWNRANRETRKELAEKAGLCIHGENFHHWDALDYWQRKRLYESIEGCDVHENDLHHEEHSATYCPEDDKIRIYVGDGDGRVQRETFNYLRKAGYKSTPKQSCTFVANWSIPAEDAALALIPDWDDIGDEDYSPQERAADRAERFSGYRDKRRGEAMGAAEKFEAGPSAFGNQSQARAERAARKHERHRSTAFTQWEKAEYWQRRTQGVIDTAEYRSQPDVRRRRIKKLESELRKAKKTRLELCERFDKWQSVLESDGNEQIIVRAGWSIDRDATSAAGRIAYDLANYRCYFDCEHPETGEKRSLFSHLTDEEHPITPKQAAELWLESFAGERPSESTRWTEHLELRIAYERQMIGDEGGMAADVEMVAGGFIFVGANTGQDVIPNAEGWAQIIRVNKSNASGLVVSVVVMGYPMQWDYGNRKRSSVLKEWKLKVEDSGAKIYRAPTEEDLAKLAEFKKSRKKTTQKKNAGKPKLINPTLEDARKLQELINQAQGREGDEAREVYETDQATYSANSKGAYARCGTEEITEQFEIFNPSYYGGTNHPGRSVVFRVRMFGGRVIVLTDKPQKPLPWDLVAEVAATKPTLAECVELLPEYQTKLDAEGHSGGFHDHFSDELKEICKKLEYHSLWQSRSLSQWGLTTYGTKLLYARYSQAVIAERDQAEAAGTDNAHADNYGRMLCRLGLMEYQTGTLTSDGEKLAAEVPQVALPFAVEATETAAA